MADDDNATTPPGAGAATGPVARLRTGLREVPTRAPAAVGAFGHWLAEQVRKLPRTAPGWRAGFRRFRRGRPFWGGLLLLLAGLELLWSSNLNPLGWQFGAPGFEGFMAYLLPSLLLLAGLFVWVTPKQRVFYSAIAVITAVYSLVGLNLGGFFVGTLLGIIGAALAFAWVPVTAPEHRDPAAADRASGDGAGGDGAGGGGHSGGRAILAQPAAPALESSPDDVAGRPTRSAPRHRATVVVPLLVALTATTALAAGGPSRAAAASSAVAAAPVVSVTPGKLTATRLELNGFRFRGVVRLDTPNGSMRVLKFTMDRSVLKNFKLVTTGPSGRRLEITTDQLVVSGNAEFYTSRFSGKLLGIPLTFTPNLPPPLTLLEMVFTSVTVDLVLLDCDSLSAPTLRQRLLK